VDQQLINERLIHADGTAQVPKALLCFGENRQALEEWFNLFGTLKTIDANNSIDSIYKSIENMFMSILDHKAAIAQKKKEEEEQKELEQKRIQEEEIARRDRELKQKMEEERAKEEEKSNKDKVDTKKVSQQRRLRHRNISNEKREDDDNKKDDDKKENNDREPDTLSVVTDDSESQHSAVPTEVEGQSSEASQEKVLNEEVAKILHDAWNRVESHFLTGAKRAFHIIRKQRDSIILHLAGTKTTFIEFLNRPANFQERVNAFETNFNEIDSDMRDHQETKQVLNILM
jgi:hypothetical protein